MVSSKHSGLTHSMWVYIQCGARKRCLYVCVCVWWGKVCNLELKTPSDLPHCVFKYEGKTKKTKCVDKVAQKKENPSPAWLAVAAPQNRHLKMRLIQPLPLRAARRKNSRKTIMYRCNQSRLKKKLNKKNAIYSTHFLFARTGNSLRRLWFVFL